MKPPIFLFILAAVTLIIGGCAPARPQPINTPISNEGATQQNIHTAATQQNIDIMTQQQDKIGQSGADASKYILGLADKFSGFSGENADTISEVLGITLVITEENEYYNIYSGAGTGPVLEVELRMNESDPKKKILILTIDPAAAISEGPIENKFPGAQMRPHMPNDPIRYSRRVTTEWGAISFGFDNNATLMDVVFDSTGS
jgi:hypothetical protein